jgi:hypothetical protein
VRPGDLIGGQQRHCLMERGDGHVLVADVAQRVRAAVQQQRPADRVAVAGELGECLVKQRHRRWRSTAAGSLREAR